jgi:hypothetical protein
MHLRRLALILGAVATAGVWYANRDASAVWALTLSLYTLLPWAFLALRAKSLGTRARGVTLAALTALTTCMFIAIGADSSSTEALVFVFVPAYQWIAVGAITAYTLVAKRRHDNYGNEA